MQEIKTGKSMIFKCDYLKVKSAHELKLYKNHGIF